MGHSTFGIVGLGLLLSGCATIIEGTGQSINVTTAPPGANCTIDRAGARLGQVSPTPGTLRIDKSKNDIVRVPALPSFVGG